ncbi:MAG: TraX family protein [Candidatus Bathyarchaeum tardum]|nr:MAG: TraX family protein [Candidatus Bathyarchaeum tardum]
MYGFDYGREVLKWIAIITMTVDHVGAVLYPELQVLRFVGRLAFPLFAYLLVLGMENTRNIKSYIIRLFMFAAVSQIPFFLAHGYVPFESLNIFFTLALGLMFVYFFQKASIFAFIPLIVSFVIHFDYGIYGLALIGCMALLRRNIKLGAVLIFLLNCLFLFPFSSQFLSLGALPLIVLHDTGSLSIVKDYAEDYKIPLWRKYFFYVYYPLHLAVLYVINAMYF